MRKCVHILFTLSLGLMLVGIVGTQEASARQQYQKALGKIYPDLLKKHGKGEEGKKKFECKVCHPGKSKKQRNDYGTALAKALGKKNEKDEDKIKEAIEKVAKEESSTKGKTFGDLIKDGKLPGTEEVVK